MAKARAAIFENIFVAVLVAAVVVLVAGQLAAAADVSVNVWGDRDLWRALTIDHHWPLYGPEINGGQRAPGGAFYLLLAAILAFGENVVAVNVAAMLLFAASIVLIGVFLARRFSPLAGALAAAALAGSVTVSQNLGVWNPGFILIFATVATLCGYSFLAGGRALALGLAVAALAVGMQIHLQITQVAAGLIVASAIYRPRLNWRHAVAVAIGLAVPFLPNLVAGGGQLLQTAGALPGQASENYVVWEVDRLWPKVQLYADLFGGGAAEFSGRVRWAQAPLLAGDVLMLAVAAVGAIAIAWRPRQAFSGGPVGLFPLILLVTAVTAVVSDLLTRHMVAAAPAAAALVGLGGEKVIVGLDRGGRLGQAGALAVCALIALRPVVAGVGKFESAPFQMESVQAQSEIATTLKPGFYPDRDAFESHVAEFRPVEAHRWIAVSNGIANHMSFLYETFAVPVSSGAPARRDCMAVVAKSDATADLRDDLKASPSLVGLDANFGAPAAESPHFLYLPYTTRDGNCLKTFPNGYIPTAFEAAHLTPDSPAAARIKDGGAIFAIAQPDRRNPLGVEIKREAAGYVAVLHGSLLRGYTGLYFRTIVAPIVCFANDDTTVAVRFGALTVGSPQRATLAPWRSPTFALADGRYRIWLIGTDGRQPIRIRDFVGELSVPDLQATLPVPAPSGQPPTECFSANRVAQRE